MTPESYTIGYCTNVHAGTDLTTIRDNLRRYSVAIRDLAGDDGQLGIGLWLPQSAARELLPGDQAAGFAKELRELGLRVFTMNGFPFDNFHQAVVKRRVYQPAWWDPARLEYTRNLAEILTVLLPESESVGSISTLPIGWPSDLESSEQLDLAGGNLRQMADCLADLEDRTGRRIVLAIEPEPGCLLDTTADVVQWFEKQLPDPNHRRYLTVCHDICHSAVMAESQPDVLAQLAAAGISIGKIQVSSAMVARWDSMSIPRRREAVEQLKMFAEDRYLHQTGCVGKTGEFRLVEDLPDLIDQRPSQDDPVGDDQRWIVHFHVPIFLERFEHLTTSQGDVLACLRALADDRRSGDPKISFSGHLEIETYAWTVLPESMRRHGLAADVSNEFSWLKQALAECSSAT